MSLFLKAAAAHHQKIGNSIKDKSNKDTMAPYFTHLLANWVKVATDMPELTANEIQKKVWQVWELKGIRKSRKKIKKKDPKAPKHPISAYVIYLTQTRVNLVKEHPDMSVKEVMSEVGQRWKKLSDEERAPFLQEARSRSEEYFKEMARYKGYF